MGNIVSVQAMLEVVASFDAHGRASPGLIAWELFADEHDILTAWNSLSPKGGSPPPDGTWPTTNSCTGSPSPAGSLPVRPGLASEPGAAGESVEDCRAGFRSPPMSTTAGLRTVARTARGRGGYRAARRPDWVLVRLG